MVFAALIGSIALLSLRAWLGVTGANVARRPACVLNGLIILFVAVVGLLVIVRFATLA